MRNLNGAKKPSRTTYNFQHELISLLNALCDRCFFIRLVLWNGFIREATHKKVTISVFSFICFYCGISYVVIAWIIRILECRFDMRYGGPE